MMSKEEILDFLLEKQGYLKEGAKRLASKLNCSEEIAAEALKEARQVVKEEQQAIEELIDEPTNYRRKWGKEGNWSYSFDGPSAETKEIKLLINELKGDLKKISPFSVEKKPSIQTDPVAIEISIPDFHFGKIDGNSIEEQANLFYNSIVELYTKVSNYEIEKFIVPIGNDLFNSEGMRSTTTKGTPQKDNSDWRHCYRVAWISIVKALNFLSTKATVDVIIVPGNHDFERTFYVGETLAAYYFNNNNVNITNNGEARNYYVYGKNLIGYTHGDKEKPYELPLIMATEVPMLFANTTYKCWHLGHLHKHMKDEYRGIEVEFLPSLCGSDEWHRQMGYSSKRRATAIIWNKEYGKEGSLQINK